MTVSHVFMLYLACLAFWQAWSSLGGFQTCPDLLPLPQLSPLRSAVVTSREHDEEFFVGCWLFNCLGCSVMALLRLEGGVLPAAVCSMGGVCS